MRSSKSRSRSKSNRPRTLGNIVNRVFDSSGPEGKVRGTPQQIIEKYHMLARDAQLSNDRVAAENFQQHAEHYTRLLGEAQREMAAEQEQRRDGNQGGNQGGGQNGNHTANQNGNQNGNQYGGYGQNAGYRDRNPRDDSHDTAPRSVPVIDLADDGDDSGLVETPEARARADMARADRPRGEYRDRAPQADRRDDRPRNPPQDRRQHQPKPVEHGAGDDSPAEPGPQPVAVEPLTPMMPSFAPPEPATPAPDAKAATPRRPRAPRKPKASDDGTGGGGPAEAAE